VLKLQVGTLPQVDYLFQLSPFFPFPQFFFAFKKKLWMLGFLNPSHYNSSLLIFFLICLNCPKIHPHFVSEFSTFLHLQDVPEARNGGSYL
jgi:hypothetical protein